MQTKGSRRQKRLQIIGGEIRYAISKMIDMHDTAGQGAVRQSFGFGKPGTNRVQKNGSKIGRRYTLCQCGGNRSENIPPVKSRAPILQEVLSIYEVPDLCIGITVQNNGKETIVRSNKQIIRCLNQDWAPIRADSWINDRQMDRSCREIGVHGAQHECSRLYILRRNSVGDIDNYSLRAASQNYALHRSNKIVLRPEVSQESDHTSRHDFHRP